MKAESIRRKAAKALYYQENKERTLAVQKAYLAKNKEKRYAYLKRRREKIRLSRMKPKTTGSYDVYHDKSRFGGLREAVIQRDKEKCVDCGLTRKEHWVLYGKDITVDHKNGIGRYAKEPDNRLENLETTCLSCHGKRDSARAVHVKRAQKR